jgi:hypothetical protein
MYPKMICSNLIILLFRREKEKIHKERYILLCELSVYLSGLCVEHEAIDIISDKTTVCNTFKSLLLR